MSFGEEVAWLSIAGDVFIGLLQMTVLPYIMFSLIVNIGRLSMDTGKKIIRYGLIFLFLLLSIGLLYLIILPLSFPSATAWANRASKFTGGIISAGKLPLITTLSTASRT